MLLKKVIKADFPQASARNPPFLVTKVIRHDYIMAGRGAHRHLLYNIIVSNTQF